MRVVISTRGAVAEGVTRGRRDRAVRTPLSICLPLALASLAQAQSFNIDFGASAAPPPTYAGVGEAGVWNAFDALPNFERVPLVGLDGAPITADIMNIGFDVIEASASGAAGDDAALLDDCFTSFNDPIDGCLFIRFVEPGMYRVIMYGLAPDDDALLSRLRIDQNAEDPELVGGAWTGQHTDGITYMSQIAIVGGDGRLDVHSGLPSGNIRSVLNGMQVVRLGESCPADLTGEGVLDLADLQLFVASFVAQQPPADFAPPQGVYDLADLQAFVAAFIAGCP